MAALEGMAAGKPVVATRVGGLAESIVDGETGFLVPPEDGRALADAIERLVADPAMARAMGRKGAARVLSNFTIAQMATQNEAYYYALLDGPVEGSGRGYFMFGSERLAEILNDFRKVNFFVVGDLMLDRFIWGEVERLSPEAPVPVLRVSSESSRLGGAANVVHNVRSLGAQVTVCGVVGADGPGKKLIDDLQRIGASTSGVFADREVKSIQKTRIIARPSHQQIVRLDRENHNPIRDATLRGSAGSSQAKRRGSMQSSCRTTVKESFTRTC